LSNSAVLVTGLGEDTELQRLCTILGIKLVNKSLLANIKIWVHPT